MSNPKYQAVHTRSNRPGWSVTFKHPKRSDSRGRLGLKIRKGLNTQDEDDAKRLVRELNTLLSDETWWSVDRRREAEQQFHPLIVAAFFDGMESGKTNSAERRQELIPLPWHKEGYSRILFTGTTGAGKTTLLRHIIGASHSDDRFPSTSTARTTTAEIEIVTAEGPFEAVVTFMPEHEVRAHVDECLEEACIRMVQQQDDEKVMNAILSHREQRFRLSYILGGWKQQAIENDGDEFDFEDDHAQGDIIPEDEALDNEEIQKNRALLESYLHRIRQIVSKVENDMTSSIGELPARGNPEEKAAWLEIFGDEIYEHDDFAALAHDIIEAIEARFERINAGTFIRNSSEWPISWSFHSEDRAAFLKQVRWFASNHYAQFGRLLTPLVDGIRVRGPFHPTPENLRVAPKLVLLDGEGIGHTAKSASSISTRVTRKFSEADLILLVDNAEQPMQAAPLELLRSVGSSGYADKIAVAFTHFDLVKGSNLGTHQLKREHVIGSARDAIGSLRQALGVPVTSTLESAVESRAFYLGGLDREIDRIPRGFQDQIQELLKLMQSSGNPPEPVDAAPIYSFEGLEIALRDAVDAFLSPWFARLGLNIYDGVYKEHWTRVKALSKRLAMAWSNEYDNLRPVADLVARLQESISRWLDSPAGWTRAPKSDEERSAALSTIRKAVFASLHELAELRLAELHRNNWTTAYEHSGTGSSYRRADEIKSIYEEAAPLISSAVSEPARAFLHTLHKLVREAVISSGGAFRVGSEIVSS